VLVGDHSTVPLTRVSCNTVFSKSQNVRKAGTLCMPILIFSPFANFGYQSLHIDTQLTKTIPAADSRKDVL
jgi:hypothetical protein